MIKMKRPFFLASVISMMLSPVIGFASKVKPTQRRNKAFKAEAGEGRLHGHIKLKGVNSNVLDVKISGSDTEGGLAMFEQTSLTQGGGTPLHVHPNQDEVFYVVDGAYQFIVGGERFRLTAGETIFLPRSVPHAWTQESEKGKMLVFLQPAGKLENFFLSVSKLDNSTPEQLARVFAENDMKVVGPPLKLE